ncbi:DUF5954 family protein [Streptomyces sp. NPDC008125]|uniref:DUF5954 family protein n=1 Tax=Streptomyces sp. NPDC008125 TaxID=3364811 RepID=UPI0036EFBFC3
MNHDDVTQAGRWRPLTVSSPEGPVAAVMEADAVDAVRNLRTLLVRGPVFGVVAQHPREAPRWRVIEEVTAGCPQLARDSLNSTLWFRAKDEARNREERRALLAAVALLEKEPVDELTVLGTRYRVVRAEEYAGGGRDDSGPEKPRPTDPEPAVPVWDSRDTDPRPDEGLILDPDAPVTPAQAAEHLLLRELTYGGLRLSLSGDVLADSRRALESHPEVMLMPTLFRVVERRGSGRWSPGGSLHARAHDARRALEFGLTWLEPRRRGLIPEDTIDRDIDARSVAADTTHPAAETLAQYARAADLLREKRADEVECHGTVHRICRVGRLLRWGPDGPERVRPSDVSSYPPTRIHPFLDDDGIIHHDRDDDEDTDEERGMDGIGGEGRGEGG